MRTNMLEVEAPLDITRPSDRGLACETSLELYAEFLWQIDTGSLVDQPLPTARKGMHMIIMHMIVMPI